MAPCPKSQKECHPDNRYHHCIVSPPRKKTMLDDVVCMHQSDFSCPKHPLSVGAKKNEFLFRQHCPIVLDAYFELAFTCRKAGQSTFLIFLCQRFSDALASKVGSIGIYNFWLTLIWNANENEKWLKPKLFCCGCFRLVPHFFRNIQSMPFLFAAGKESKRSLLLRILKCSPTRRLDIRASKAYPIQFISQVMPVCNATFTVQVMQPSLCAKKSMRKSTYLPMGHSKNTHAAKRDGGSAHVIEPSIE